MQKRIAVAVQKQNICVATWPGQFDYVLPSQWSVQIDEAVTNLAS